MHSFPKVLRVGILMTAAVFGFAGCSNDTTGPAKGQLYWQLQLNHHAVTLATVAPYDTVQLVVTPLDATGTPITTAIRPVFTSSDTSVVIDSTGFMRVHRTGSNKKNIVVVAMLTVGGVTGETLVDTAIVNVVSFQDSTQVPKMDSLLFHPIAGDSARRVTMDVSGSTVKQSFVTPVVKDVSGGAIQNVVVHYWSSDPLIANFANSTTGTVTAVSPGIVLLTAEATVYGRSLKDSLWYTVGYPLYAQVAYGQGFGFISEPLPPNRLSLGNIVIGQGGTVTWLNKTYGLSDDSLDVQFDDTTGIVGFSVPTTVNGISFPASSGGDVSAFPAAGLTTFIGVCCFFNNDSTNSRIRKFVYPGVYHWSSLHQNTGGSIRVVSNDSLRAF